ncbi:MAG: two-component system, NarL family, sensor kinase [Solirubrobacteraceae bacterium]|nr:two-component system, NarL family, sensor kinase [Solirubrobacteraceae bacterium]
MDVREQSVGRAVLQFALTGLAALLVLGLVGVQVLRSTGTEEAIADAKRVTRLAADAVVAPDTTPGVLAGRRADLARLDGLVRGRLLRDPVVRVKVWDASGRIVYSDDPRLIGSRYPLGADEVQALRDHSVDAAVSDLSRPENRFERPYGKLLEVYQGIRATDGRPLLFESYQRFGSVAASGRRLWLRFLPALVGALLLLEIVQIPLAYLLARRLRDRQRERSRLLERAIDASEGERRRLAGELHDGPVQELAGVAFSLSAVAGRLNGDDAARAAVDEAAQRTRGTMRDLRSMLVELYPATLHRSGLQAAVSDLLGRLQREGVQTACDIPADLQLPEAVEALVFRAAREALQNVRKHAGAAHVAVTVERREADVVLAVVDDGRGFESAEALRADGEPHFGLRLVADLAQDAGGRLRLDAIPGRGTRVCLEVPLP